MSYELIAETHFEMIQKLHPQSITRFMRIQVPRQQKRGRTVLNPHN